MWHAECQHISHKTQSEQSSPTMSRTTNGLFPFNSKSLPSSIPFLKMTLCTNSDSVTCEKMGEGKLTLSSLPHIRIIVSRLSEKGCDEEWERGGKTAKQKQSSSVVFCLIERFFCVLFRGKVHTQKQCSDGKRTRKNKV